MKYRDFGKDTKVSICFGCGAVVADPVTHDLFHAFLDRVAATAQAADATASWLRPLA